MLALSAFTYHSTKKEFLRYVNHETVKKLNFLTQALEADFAYSQSFASFKNKPAKWKRLINRTFQPQFVSQTSNPDGLSRNSLQSTLQSPSQGSSQRISQSSSQGSSRGKQRIQAKPSPHQRQFMQRLILTQSDKTHIVGKKAEHRRYTYVPIRHNQNIVGFVGYIKPTRFIRANDQRFIEKQITILSVTSLFLLVISVAAAFVVSHWLTTPIVELRKRVKRLTQGDFSKPLHVQSHDEIGALSQDINELAHTLETNETSRKRWVADISHEMRTPVAVLKAQIEAVQDGIRPPNAENMQLLHTKVQALNTLIDDLYMLSLSDAGALNYAKKSININTFYCQQAEHYNNQVVNNQLINKEINLHFKACTLPAEACLHGDEQKLKQLIENLIENAIRYTDAPGTITCECDIVGTMLELHINDSKPGVSDAQLDKIFERLYRTENSRSRETGGAGLGLAICKNIVQAHGGDITARHSKLGGIHTIVRLPVNNQTFKP